jgi:hypothetical protein
MNVEEFREMERICKEAWRELSITGSEQKPIILYSFLNACPACHISCEDTRSFWSKTGNIAIQNCRLCPIDRWRNIATELDAHSGDTICDMPGEYFYCWRKFPSAHRKIFAEKIALLSWTYLPEYKDKPKVD